MSHIIRGDLNLLRALELNGSAGTSGQIIRSAGATATPTWSAISSLLSADVGNSLTTGVDGNLFFEQDLTSLSYNAGTTTLTFTNENGTVTNIDLSALTTDIYITGASFNAATTVLTLTDADGVTPDVTVNLSTLRSVVTDNGNGTYSHNDGNGTIVTINARQGVSTDAGNDLTNGTDNRPYLAETVTTISLQPTSILRYTDEAAAQTNISLISADANNRLASGTDNALYVRQIRSVVTFNAAGDWGAAAGGVYTQTIPAASFQNANATAIFQVQSGAAAPFQTSLALESATLAADGAVALQVTETPDGRFAGRVVYIA